MRWDRDEATGRCDPLATGGAAEELGKVIEPNAASFPHPVGRSYHLSFGPPDNLSVFDGKRHSLLAASTPVLMPPPSPLLSLSRDGA